VREVGGREMVGGMMEGRGGWTDGICVEKKRKKVR